MSKLGRKRNYESYKRDYNIKKRQLAANGVVMHEQMYTERQFNAQYERLLNQRKEDIKAGKRKTTGNITRTLIDKQAFAFSVKQSEAISEKKKDEFKNYYQRRSGDVIAEAYYRYKSEYQKKHPEATDAGLHASKEIGAEFFGS